MIKYVYLQFTYVIYFGPTFHIFANSESVISTTILTASIVESLLAIKYSLMAGKIFMAEDFGVNLKSRTPRVGIAMVL